MSIFKTTKFSKRRTQTFPGVLIDHVSRRNYKVHIIHVEEVHVFSRQGNDKQ